jgi:hypothetical protein
MILPKLVNDLERQAEKEEYNTILPVSLKKIFFFYARLFDIKEACSAVELTTTQERKGKVGEFIASDIVEIVLSLMAVVKERPRWEVCPQAQKADPGTVLACIVARPELQQELLLERQLEQWALTILFTPQEWLSRQTKEWTLLPFTPVELLKGKDLEVLQHLLEECLLTTTIAYPAQSNWSRRRASEFIARGKVIKIKDFHLHFDTLPSILSSTCAVRDLFILLDAHLLSTQDFLVIHDWLLANNITRMLVIGATDTLPFLPGRAFEDLLRKAGRDGKIFDHDLHRKNHRLLWEEAAGKIECLTLDKLQDVIKEKILPKRRVFIHVLQKEFYQGELNVKFKAAHGLLVGELPLDQLARLDQTSKYKEEQHFFLIGEEELRLRSRNELNHLLLEVPSLLVVCDIKPKEPHKLVKDGKCYLSLPNSRYTLAFLSSWRRRSVG